MFLIFTASCLIVLAIRQQKKYEKNHYSQQPEKKIQILHYKYPPESKYYFKWEIV